MLSGIVLFTGNHSAVPSPGCFNNHHQETLATVCPGADRSPPEIHAGSAKWVNAASGIQLICLFLKEKMNSDPVRLGFMGAGGIARAHAYALNSLKFYYSDTPQIIFEAVTSARKESRDQFARISL